MIDRKNSKFKINKNILITAAYLSPGGINTVLSLKKYCRKIIGVDVVDKKPLTGLVENFYLVPLAKKEKLYIFSILKICKKEKIDIVLPLTIEELVVLLKNIKIFNYRGIKIAGENNLRNVLVCNDKWLTNNFLKNNNVEVPASFAVDNLKQYDLAAKRLGYLNHKLIFKPRITHGSRGLRIINQKYDSFDQLINKKPIDSQISTFDELRLIFKKTNHKFNGVLMDYLVGDDYSVYTFCSDGIGLVVMPFKRLSFWPGSAISGQIVNDQIVIDYVKKIILAFGFNGVINCQLIKTAIGPLLYEINTRISATTIAALAAGVNLPLLLLLQTIGKNQQAVKIINQTKIKWGLELLRTQQEHYFYQNKSFNIYD